MYKPHELILTIVIASISPSSPSYVRQRDRCLRDRCLRYLGSMGIDGDFSWDKTLGAKVKLRGMCWLGDPIYVFLGWVETR